jgi:hypothetical protein
LDGCKIYVGLSVFAYNLHIFGNPFKARAKVEDESKKTMAEAASLK